MRTITFETLSGKKIFIDNSGDCWMLTTEDSIDATYFSSLDKAIEFARHYYA